LPKELIDACLQHSVSSRSLTLSVGNFNLKLNQFQGFMGLKKIRQGILPTVLYGAKKNEHDFDRYISQ
jgi:hypothetical protein